MRRLSFILSILLLSTLPVSAGIVLVEEGKGKAVILIPEKATRAAQYGALEFQHHLRLVSGAAIPILRTDRLKNGICIHSGPGQAPSGMPPERMFHGEEYAVDSLKGDIFFRGTEQAEYDVVRFESRKTWPLKPDNSLLFAVYDFLEKALDIRWYAPGEPGTVYTRRKDIIVEPFNLSRKPDMDAYRLASDAMTFKTETETEFPQDEMIRYYLRLRTTKRYGYSNHNMSSIYFRYWKKAKDPQYAALFLKSRPEFFARGLPPEWRLLPERITRQYPGEIPPPQICDSNPEVIEYFAREAVEFKRTRKLTPGARREGTMIQDAPFYYPLEFEDNQGFCRCPECVQLFPGKEEDELRSLRRTRFLNEVAGKAAELDPSVGIAGLSYSPFHCPENMPMKKNVSIAMCFTTERWADPEIGKRGHDTCRQWVEKSGRYGTVLSIWYYLFNGAVDARVVFKYKDYFPQFHFRAIGRRMREFANDGIRGIYVSRCSASFFTTQLEEYVMFRMAYDSTLDPDAVIDEFFRKYYGRSGVPMKKFYDTIEQTVADMRLYPESYFTDRNRKRASYSGLLSQDICWGSLGTPERMAFLRGCIREANALADSPEVKTRLKLFEDTVWAMMERGEKAYAERQHYRKRPVAETSAAFVPNVNGDPRKVDWANVPVCFMKTINGAPVSPEERLQFASDANYLYIHYQEPKTRTGYAYDPLRKWKGDIIEFFFAPNRGTRPYFQLAVFPNGETESRVYRNVNMIDISSPYDFEPKIYCSTEQGWDVYMALPLKNILSEAGTPEQNSLCANVFRNIPKRESHAWSPIFGRDFHDLTRMGVIRLEPEKKRAK